MKMKIPKAIVTVLGWHSRRHGEQGVVDTSVRGRVFYLKGRNQAVVTRDGKSGFRVTIWKTKTEEWLESGPFFGTGESCAQLDGWLAGELAA